MCNSDTFALSAHHAKVVNRCATKPKTSSLPPQSRLNLLGVRVRVRVMIRVRVRFRVPVRVSVGFGLRLGFGFGL
jgi:hypothetical protein